MWHKICVLTFSWNYELIIGLLNKLQKTRVQGIHGIHDDASLIELADNIGSIKTAKNINW